MRGVAQCKGAGNFLWKSDCEGSPFALTPTSAAAIAGRLELKAAQGPRVRWCTNNDDLILKDRGAHCLRVKRQQAHEIVRRRSNLPSARHVQFGSAIAEHFGVACGTKGVAERHTLEEPNNLQSGNVSGRPRPMRTRRRSWPPCPHTFLRRRRARQACSSKPFADQTVRCVIASRWPFASQKMCAWLWPSSGFHPRQSR